MGERRGLAGWQIGLMSTAGALASVAVANWLTSRSAGEPGAELPGAEALYPWTEGTIHYTVKGRGEPLILLHGLYPGASAYEFRGVFDTLAERYRVFAPDLLGYGRSGRPAMDYTPQLYVTLIEDFLRQVAGATDQPAHVIASGLSAAFATLAATNRPRTFRSLTFLSPLGLEAEPPVGDSIVTEATRLLLRAPLLGEGVYNLLTSRPSLRAALRRRLEQPTPRVSDDVLDHVYSSAHQPGARFAPADALSGALDVAAGEAFAALNVPTLLIWGQRDPASQRPLARALGAARPSVRIRLLESGAAPHEEAPEAFTRVALAWMGSTARV